MASSSDTYSSLNRTVLLKVSLKCGVGHYLANFRQQLIPGVWYIGNNNNKTGWNVIEFKIHIFLAWKVLENQPNDCHIFYLSTCFRPLYTLSLSTIRLSLIGCLV